MVAQTHKALLEPIKKIINTKYKKITLFDVYCDSYLKSFVVNTKFKLAKYKISNKSKPLFCVIQVL